MFQARATRALVQRNIEPGKHGKQSYCNVSKARGVKKFEKSLLKRPAVSRLYANDGLSAFGDLDVNFIDLDHAELHARLLLDHFKTFLQIPNFCRKFLVGLH